MDNCDPNWFINEDKITALHLFVINDDIKLIELLFTSSKIHVNSRDWLLRIPLHYSCQNGNLKSVRILMKRGANPRALAWETEEKDKLSIPYNWSPFPLQTEIGLILFPKEKEKEYKLSDIFMLILILFIIFK